MRTETLTEVCQYLRNWFELSKHFGTITIADGQIAEDLGMQGGQYYRIIGSVFNDGVHKYPDDTLADERPFDGAVWLMAVPPDLIALVEEIETWIGQYGGVDSPAQSPYNSESFAGYSYQKSVGSKGASDPNEGTNGWVAAYGQRIRRWKKL